MQLAPLLLLRLKPTRLPACIAGLSTHAPQTACRLQEGDNCVEEGNEDPSFCCTQGFCYTSNDRNQCKWPTSRTGGAPAGRTPNLASVALCI